MIRFLNFNSDCLVNILNIGELYRDGLELVLVTDNAQYVNGYATEQEAIEAIEYFLHLIDEEDEE